MGPVTVINRIIVKPGRMDEFIQTQRTYADAITSSGYIGGRMYRSVDGASAVLVSTFRSRSDQEQIIQRADFKEHLLKLQPLVESSNPFLYEEAYTTGQFR